MPAPKPSNDPAQKEPAPPPTSRLRDIDHMKRLFAVIMGFAATSGMAQAAITIRAADDPFWRVWVTVIASAVVITSTIALVYWTVERHLEATYLNPEFRNPPRLILLWDVSAMLITAGVLVAVVYSFPSPRALSDINDSVDHWAVLVDWSPIFARSLFFYYCWDALSMLVTFGLSYLPIGKVYIKSRKSLAGWVAVDLVFLAALTGAWYYMLPYCGLTLLAIFTATVHAFRLVAEVYVTPYLFLSEWKVDQGDRSRRGLADALVSWLRRRRI